MSRQERINSIHVLTKIAPDAIQCTWGVTNYSGDGRTFLAITEADGVGTPQKETWRWIGQLGSLDVYEHKAS